MDVIDKMVKNFAREQLRVRLKEIGEMASAEMKEIKNDIVDEWFEGYNPRSMKLAMTVSTPQVRTYQDGSGGELRIKLWVNVARYEPKLKANKWAETYGGSLSGEMYVLENQLDKGILALPEKATHRPDSNWVNEYFAKQNNGRVPLWGYLINNPRWDSWFKKYKAMISGTDK